MDAPRRLAPVPLDGATPVRRGAAASRPLSPRPGRARLVPPAPRGRLQLRRCAGPRRGPGLQPVGCSLPARADRHARQGPGPPRRPRELPHKQRRASAPSHATPRAPPRPQVNQRVQHTRADRSPRVSRREDRRLASGAVSVNSARVVVHECVCASVSE